MAVDNEMVERVAVGLADLDDEFSWYWLDDGEKEGYRDKARKLVEDFHCASCDGHACDGDLTQGSAISEKAEMKVTTANVGAENDTEIVTNLDLNQEQQDRLAGLLDMLAGDEPETGGTPPTTPA